MERASRVRQDQPADDSQTHWTGQNVDDTSPAAGLRIEIRGVVQGVGFRPFVFRLAVKHGLAGWVCNTSGDVKIEVEGNRQALDHFLEELTGRAPPLSHIEDVSVANHAPGGHTGFVIRESIVDRGEYQLVSPDIATCQACLDDILAPDDPRYRYPFTNCTNCGPRFTIIDDIPYDRAGTTMRRFTMCSQCQREYGDPADRRFHAQPNACPACGPSLVLIGASGDRVATGGDALATAAVLLREGSIIAVKGLGGFLLACNATSETAVGRLRQRKRRSAKPLAVMVATLEQAGAHCEISEKEEELLASPECPIVLMRWKRSSSMASSVAPGLDHLGVMLPYTPLHHLLLREIGLPLVMTSGNMSEEPIAKDNDEALVRLACIADYFLLHDRDIRSRYDDSVALVELDRPRLVRRARGYAPFPVRLPSAVGPVLACGADLKNTFCLTRDNHAFVSQHIGDMENLETLEHLHDTIDLYQGLFRIEPEMIACDMHPDYQSTGYARSLAEARGSLPLVPVQHHHAHIVSCMVENGIEDPVIGVAFDGTGYGSDGCVWGGEFLVADYRGFERMGHLEYVPMPGGEAAIERPYRMAMGYVLMLLGEGSFTQLLAFRGGVSREERGVLMRQIEGRINSPLTSSCGRLFDAVSALTGFTRRVDYEAQAAIELEAAAEESDCGNYTFSIEERDGVSVILLGELLAEVVGDVMGGTPRSVVSARFHKSVADMACRMCGRTRERTGIGTVALSGGVFQNRLLFRLTVRGLESEGFRVLTHSKVPSNDGGVSLGQAMVASSKAL